VLKSCDRADREQKDQRRKKYQTSSAITTITMMIAISAPEPVL
jgi:hypothetical protein